MFHKKATLTLMIFLTAFPLITSQTESTLSTSFANNDEEADRISAIRKCFAVCFESKKDLSQCKTEQYLGIICNRNRVRKIEFTCNRKLQKAGYIAEAADFMQSCLKPNPSTYDHYFNRGVKVQKAREFMEKESLEETPLPFTEPESCPEELRVQLYQNPTPGPEKNTLQSSEAFDIGDVSELNNYSTFSDGLCYTRHILDSNQEVSNDANCLMPCVETMFIGIEKILLDEVVEIKKPLDKSSIIFQPEANIFEIVCRLTGVKTIEEFTKLGAKWLNNYRTIYRNFEINHYAKLEKLEIAIAEVMNSYLKCLQKASCTTNSSATKNLPFCDWIPTTHTDYDSHYHDANDNSIMPNDSSMNHDLKYHDANDNSKMLNESDTSHAHKHVASNEIIGQNTTKHKHQKESLKRKLISERSDLEELDSQAQKKIK